MPVISSVQVPFEKWQRRFIKFGSDEMVGHGYYKAIETGELYGPIDSNKRLAETPAIVLFDRTFPPGERMINDWLVGKESLLLNAVDRVTTNRIMTIEDKIEIAQRLALHACRYPDLFGRRINIDRYYALRFTMWTCFLIMLLLTHICDGAGFHQIPGLK